MSSDITSRPHKILAMAFLAGSLIIAGIHPVHAKESACASVDRSLADEDRQQLASVIAERMQTEDVEVMESFSMSGWRILYIDSPEADPAFQFYSGDPMHDSYVTQWSGAARTSEKESIKAWAIKNAPEIPPQLAGCFASYVTSGRSGM